MSGLPASPLYNVYDITKWKHDWQPVMVQIMDRPECATEYVKLDNELWYILEADGSFTHMTDHEFGDFLQWKRAEEQATGSNDATDEDTPMEDQDSDEDTPMDVCDSDDDSEDDDDSSDEDGPDPTLHMLNSEIEALDAEMEDIDSQIGGLEAWCGSDWDSDSDLDVEMEETPQAEEEETKQQSWYGWDSDTDSDLDVNMDEASQREDEEEEEEEEEQQEQEDERWVHVEEPSGVQVRVFEKTGTVIDQFGELDTWENFERKHFRRRWGRLPQCTWYLLSNRWVLPMSKEGVPEIKVITPEGEEFSPCDPLDDERWT